MMIRRAFLSMGPIFLSGLWLKGILPPKKEDQIHKLHAYEKAEITKFEKRLKGLMNDSEIGEEVTQNICTPVKILKRSKSYKRFSFQFLNKSGEKVLITNLNGESTIEIA